MKSSPEGTATDAELRRALEALAAVTDLPHVRRMSAAVALISEALRNRGMEVTLVGGGAIEFHAPDAHTTSDIDLVVEGGSRAEIDRALTALGFNRQDRHWVCGSLYVEVPGHRMSDPTEVFSVGSRTVRVVRKEVVLADRVTGFKHWKVTAYGAQALALIAAFRQDLDEGLLRQKLRAEDAEDAFDALRRLAASAAPVTDDVLQAELTRLHVRPGLSRTGETDG